MQKKYLIEKIVHELIRDIPEARRISQQYENGLVSTEVCLRELAAILEAVRRGTSCV